MTSPVGRRRGGRGWGGGTDQLIGQARWWDGRLARAPEGRLRRHLSGGVTGEAGSQISQVCHTLLLLHAGVMQRELSVR